MTYERLMKNKPILRHTHENGDETYYVLNLGLEYLVRNKKVIISGHAVWSCNSMDYYARHEVGNGKTYTILKRKGITLYRTDVGERLYPFDTKVKKKNQLMFFLKTMGVNI